MIRLAESKDKKAIWAILGPVIRAGETYAINRDISENDALAFWLSPDRETFVFDDNGEVYGTYYICANKDGGGAHVANCGYMTAPSAQGRGIARRMGMHSISHAKSLGFRAIQFNFVVSNNTRAIKLWQSLDFEIVGRLPGAFNHPSLGYIDALIMFREL